MPEFCRCGELIYDVEMGVRTCGCVDTDPVSTCDECDGEGYTMPLFANAVGILENRRRDCLACRGTGRSAEAHLRG